MSASSDAVASSLITAVQRDIGVWVRRAVSAVAWRRCHLVCHWLQDPSPFKCTIVGPGERKARYGNGATPGESCADTGIGKWALPPPVNVRSPHGDVST